MSSIPSTCGLDHCLHSIASTASVMNFTTLTSRRSQTSTFIAIAMDEHRQPFGATIWRKPKFKSFATATEQVWFPGSHSDVGGGYIDEERRPEKHPRALDDLTLDWMLKRLIFHFPNFPFNESCWKKIAPNWAAASQHEARTWFYKMIPRALRSISNCPVPLKAWRYEREVSRNRHDETIGEMIHISVIERLGKPVRGRLWKRKYKPRNFVNMLDAVKHTYGMLKDAARDQPSIQIVGWDGRPLDPKVDADRLSASQLLNAATQRLG
jgi:Uncharacterized alpha/beta hydrolase domain (DUF2235)